MQRNGPNINLTTFAVLCTSVYCDPLWLVCLKMFLFIIYWIFYVLSILSLQKGMSQYCTQQNYQAGLGVYKHPGVSLIRIIIIVLLLFLQSARHQLITKRYTNQRSFYYIFSVQTYLRLKKNPQKKFGNFFYPSISHLFNSYMQEIWSQSLSMFLHL